ncbi:protein of unknown function [Taphrina deformans PYCC 5710]|uniref:GDP-Man:Man(3)GlcNAc(2)-PP-Dol alpha-1,2-mannosyltransferase n=1 Tax=Taphrina deformans (strain PYCC 5710 / ATCC 11124 / CBS 356.35 / IMI 108563 / JCM 9778 / NBRC 8474) TaxID=1097556 RepID=R4XNF3_TAPDE|nr:protein of unknown function [Taphrina deformans PYCC 5710]|eukprot:CCG84774.1 protein of unknown function [Taphrina deformans PYCC 5710]
MFDKISRTNIVKMLYWRLFAMLYAGTGQFADIVMANSSWTMSHLSRIWKLEPNRLSIVYPPCDTKALSQITVDKMRNKDIVCVAQFRPEKDHATIIKAFAVLVHDLMPELAHTSRLILIGTVRNQSDRVRLQALRALTEELHVNRSVDFHEDLPWSKVIERLGQSWIGTNAMWNEHFGIGVVEYMAAGLLAVAHDSAGPKMDIVVDFEKSRTGYRATDVLSFAECYASALRLDVAECAAMRRRAQKSSARFSEDIFASAWQRVMIETMKIEKSKRLARNHHLQFPMNGF